MTLVEKLKFYSGGLVYFTVGCLLVFSVLVIINYKVYPLFSFLSVNQTKSQPEPSVHMQTLMVISPAPGDTALVFNNIVNMNPLSFSISFDCFLNGQYLSTDVPRVLLYFAKNPADITSNKFHEYVKDIEPVPQILGTVDTDILKLFPDTNMIIYADSVKNDLKVGIITIDKKDNKFVELLPTITNIPINQTFQITVVISSTIVEIYQNKKLLFTYVLQNTLTASAVDAKLYSPINFIGNTIKIGNIQYFDTNITSMQVRTLTNDLKPALFFTK